VNVHIINPLVDDRWLKLVEHSESSIFHTRGWLNALQRTYGYAPIVFTSSPPGAALSNGLLFCDIHTWIGGRRLVSLPFSDHCAPLGDWSKDLSSMLTGLKEAAKERRWRYIEFRTADALVSEADSFQKTEGFRFHRLDLRPSLEDLFRGFHKNCVQRKIHRAEREQLSCQAGRSAALLDQFYGLFLMTRRRLGLPPQPLSWFRHLIGFLGESLTIYIAYCRNTPIAGIITLRHKDVLVYKYGASDYDFRQLGGTQLAFWNAIQDAKRSGLREMDFGRSDLDDSGLITFKDRWGARSSALDYWQYSRRPAEASRSRWPAKLVKPLFRHLPDGILRTAGKMLYKYAG
jgi:hypothetical protein